MPLIQCWEGHPAGVVHPGVLYGVRHLQPWPLLREAGRQDEPQVGGAAILEPDWGLKQGLITVESSAGGYLRREFHHLLMSLRRVLEGWKTLAPSGRMNAGVSLHTSQDWRAAQESAARTMR